MIAEPRTKSPGQRLPSRPRDEGHGREVRGDTQPRQAREDDPADETSAENSLVERTPANADAAPSRQEYPVFDADEEESYWETVHADQPYARDDDFERYAAAYRIGFEGFNRLGAENSFDDVEEELQEEYEAEGSPLSWERVREAARAAWDRLEERFPS